MSSAYYTSLRNAFYLHEYAKVLKIWNDSADNEKDVDLLEVNWIIARSLLGISTIQSRTSLKISRQPSETLLQLVQDVTQSMEILLKPGSTKEDIETQHQQFQSIFQAKKHDPIFIMINLIFKLHTGKEILIEELVDLQQFAFFMEGRFLAIKYYLINDDSDKAKLMARELMSRNDEDILSYLANYEMKLYNGEYVAAQSIVNGLKEANGDCLKLMNMRLTAMIMNLEMTEAGTLAGRIYEWLEKNPQYLDIQAAEDLLEKLISLNYIFGKQTQPIIEALRSISPKCQTIVRIDQRKQELKKAIEQFRA